MAKGYWVVRPASSANVHASFYVSALFIPTSPARLNDQMTT